MSEDLFKKKDMFDEPMEIEQIDASEVKVRRRTKTVVWCERLIESGAFDERVMEEGKVVMVKVPAKEDETTQATAQRARTIIEILVELDDGLEGKLRYKKVGGIKDGQYKIIFDPSAEDGGEEE